MPGRRSRLEIDRTLGSYQLAGPTDEPCIDRNKNRIGAFGIERLLMSIVCSTVLRCGENGTPGELQQ